MDRLTLAKQLIEGSGLWSSKFLPTEPFRSAHISERIRATALVVMLATEMYHRERGSLPHSEEALVGTYLKSLPDDGWAELDDGTVPTLR